MKLKAVIVSFSSRTDGNCAKIGKLIKENTRDSVCSAFQIFPFMPVVNAIMTVSKKVESVLMSETWNVLCLIPSFKAR